MSYPSTRWQLPEAIADVLPEQAKHIEQLRSQLLTHFLSYGYEPIIPPMIQYLDSLLIGSGSDLGLQTFTLVDQLSGRTLGVRADMTPQAARIDAHLLKSNEINRLCYCGSVLRTQPTHLRGSREMIQMGAEMFGCDQMAADQESLALLLTAFGRIGLSNLLIDLCHAGLVESLLDDCQLDQLTENAVLAALQAKDQSALAMLLKNVSAPLQTALLALPTLYGDSSAVLMKAKAVFQSCPNSANSLKALDELEMMVDWLQHQFAQQQPHLHLKLHIDLADLRGYHYHTGLMFTVYIQGFGKVNTVTNPIAYGGRYDGVGEGFGRTRPAVGFSFDLLQLSEIVEVTLDVAPVVAAPPLTEGTPEAKLLCQAIGQTRSQGVVVIQYFSDKQFANAKQQCQRQFVWHEGQWQIVEMV